MNYYSYLSFSVVFVLATIANGGDKKDDREYVFKVPGDSSKGCSKVHSISVIKATPESVKEYGRIIDDKNAELDIVTWPKMGWRAIAEGTGNRAGKACHIFEIRWDNYCCYATDHEYKQEYFIGWFAHQAIVTHEVDYHPDGGQILYPLNHKPFILVVALPGDDVLLKDFVAFYFDGTVGFHINPGVWHQLPFPVKESLELYSSQNALYTCVDCDFIEEFDCLLAIDLKF